MGRGWQDDHDQSWERENRRAEQEKWEEKYWSEIEDGICPKTPVSRPITETKGQPPAWAADLEKLIEEFKAKGRIK